MVAREVKDKSYIGIIRPIPITLAHSKPETNHRLPKLHKISPIDLIRPIATTPETLLSIPNKPDPKIMGYILQTFISSPELMIIHNR